MSYLTGFLLIIPVFCDFVSHLVPNDILHFSALISDFEKYKHFVTKIPNCTNADLINGFIQLMLSMGPRIK